MFNKFLKITLITLVMAFVIGISTQNPVSAQDSYLDSIYQAVSGESGTSALEPETPPSEVGGVVIDTDDSNATVTVGSEPGTSTDTDAVQDTATDTGNGTANNEELQHINVVLNDMTRILIGMNMGVPIDTSKFTIIDLLGGSTSTEEDTDTSTSTSTSSSTDTQTETSSDTETSTDVDTDTVPNTDTDTNINTDTTPTDEPGLNPDTPDTGGDAGSDTNTATSSDTNSDTSIDTGTENSVDNNTDPEAISELKSLIKSKYGITCTDGTAKFTVTQLRLMAETLEKLPPDFRACTTEFIRDNKKSDAEEDSDVAGYVIRPESKVHILDRAVTFTSDIIEGYENLNGPCSDEKLRKWLEFEYLQTLVHEMTHCLQHKDFDEENTVYNDVTRAWEETFWPGGNIKGQSVSSYGNTKFQEDMAECVAMYVAGGVILKDENGTEYFKTNSPFVSSSKMDIERYNFIKNNIMGGKEFITEHYGSTTISL